MKRTQEYMLTVQLTYALVASYIVVSKYDCLKVDLKRLAERLNVTLLAHSVSGMKEDISFTCFGYPRACAFLKAVRALSYSNKLARRVQVHGHLLCAPRTKLVVR